MPIYEYKCLKCGQKFEKILLSAAVVKVECSSCGSTEVERELSTFASRGEDQKEKAPTRSGGHSGHSGMG